MRDRVNEQLGQALDQFDDPDMTLSSHIRRAIRIAGLSNDYENLYWLELEMRSIENNTDWTRIATEFAAHWPADKRSEIESAVWDTYRRERGYHERDVLGKPIKEKRCQRGVEQIEADIVKFSEAIDELRSDLQASEGGLHDVMRQARLASPRKYRANAEDYNRILLKIRTRVHTFLSSVERETAYSDANAGIFEHYRSYVDGKLSALAPKVLGQFVAAYQRVAEGHPGVNPISS